MIEYPYQVGMEDVLESKKLQISFVSFTMNPFFFHT